MKVAAPSLAPILRSATQGRILARVLSDPEAEHSMSDLAKWADTSFPTVQREITRAERAGIVTTRKVGPTRLVKANPDHPLHGALSQLVLATFGPPAVIAREFAELKGVDAVVLFGSWAARYLGVPGREPQDIDVLILGNPERDLIDDAAERAEQLIGFPVQPTIRSLEQWQQGTDSFIGEVKRRPLVPLLVDDAQPLLVEELRHAGQRRPSS